LEGWPLPFNGQELPENNMNFVIILLLNTLLKDSEPVIFSLIEPGLNKYFETRIEKNFCYIDLFCRLPMLIVAD